jgi:hypothetical protein
MDFKRTAAAMPMDFACCHQTVRWGAVPANCTMSLRLVPAEGLEKAGYGFDLNMSFSGPNTAYP